MTDLLLALLGAGLGLYWWQRALECRALANEAASELCANEGLVLLDGTVAFQGLRLARDARGRHRLERRYAFAYTVDGMSRAQGAVVLLGGELAHVGCLE
jgi:hypothetical protein